MKYADLNDLRKAKTVYVPGDLLVNLLLKVKDIERQDRNGGIGGDQLARASLMVDRLLENIQ